MYSTIRVNRFLGKGVDYSEFDRMFAGESSSQQNKTSLFVQSGNLWEGGKKVSNWVNALALPYFSGIVRVYTCSDTINTRPLSLKCPSLVKNYMLNIYLRESLEYIAWAPGLPPSDSKLVASPFLLQLGTVLNDKRGTKSRRGLLQVRP